MFSHLITRTALGAVLAATLLAPAAAADSWGRDPQDRLDPAIEAAILKHQEASPARPDDRAGTRAVAGDTATPIPLDPAIQAALLAHQAANWTPRPDDRAGIHGTGVLPESAAVAATSGGVDPKNLGVGAGVVLCALLVAIACASRLRHLRTRVHV